VEAYASKTAMEALVRERIAGGRSSLVPGIMEDKGKDRITSSVVERALAEGDEVMREVVAVSRSYLAVLTANVVNALDPEVVVFGGGIVERLGDSFVGPIAAEARPRFIRKDPEERIRVVAGALGDDAGTVGAAVEAGRRLLATTV
jgi:glucokinase